MSMKEMTWTSIKNLKLISWAPERESLQAYMIHFTEFICLSLGGIAEVFIGIPLPVLLPQAPMADPWLE